ncbi:MAG TPA: NADP-dependent isocitrate dehydrogenase, partial [Ktedonobacteraceae bacterium]|jgi:isocitrate dehydrogenase
LISRPGSEKIIRYAFEYAHANNRKKVTCFIKDNIMKMTDGLFHKVFDEVAREYPDIQNESWIVDIGAAKLADTPEAFDVVVMPNLYGDILSDVTAQIAGSVGLAGSANIGDQCAMFEAIHGSAPRRAGQNLANPSGLLLGAVLMLVHIGQPEIATRIHNAWLRTIEDGIHTYDIFKDGISKQKVGTKEFASAVIERLGQEPQILKPVYYRSSPKIESIHQHAQSNNHYAQKELVGIDIFLDWDSGRAEELAGTLQQCNGDGLELTLIANRGAKLWPNGLPETFTTDQWRCRFKAMGEDKVTHVQVIELLQRIDQHGLDFIKTEHLYTFDGQVGYSVLAGE